MASESSGKTLQTADCPVQEKILVQAIALLVQQGGYSDIEVHALNILSELSQCFILQLSQSAKEYCEVGGRNGATANDLYMALIDSGYDVPALISWFSSCNLSQQAIREPAKAPGVAPVQLSVGNKLLSVTQAAESGRVRPNHVPSYFPPFPDSHTYIATPAERSLPVSSQSYQTIREKLAYQRRDVEKSLCRVFTNSLLSEYSVITLFASSPRFCPILEMQPSATPYLDALWTLEDRAHADDAKSDGDRKKQSEESSAGTEAALFSKSGDAQSADSESLHASSALKADIQLRQNPFLKPPCFSHERRRRINMF